MDPSYSAFQEWGVEGGGWRVVGSGFYFLFFFTTGWVPEQREGQYTGLIPMNNELESAV